MKKLIPIFLVFFFISTCFNITRVSAESKTFKQGIYTWSDSGLPANSSLTIKLGESTSKAIVMVIDSDQTMESLLRLNTRVTHQVLPPLTYTSSIIIFTNGNVIFS